MLRERCVGWLWIVALVTAPGAAWSLSWTQTKTPPGGMITALALGGSSPGVLYAGTVSAGTFVSSDGGATWIPRGGGLTAGIVYLLAVDPLRPERAFAAVDLQGLSQIFHTEDGGAHWAVVPSQGSSSNYVNDLVVDPFHRGRVYAATYGGLMEWQEGMSEAKVVGFAGTDVQALAIDPRRGAYYAGVEDPDSGATLFEKSADGRVWRPLAVPYDSEGGPQIVLDPSRPDTLYVLPVDLVPETILKSGDGGTSWTSLAAVAPPDLLVVVEALLAAPDGVLYAATSQGVVRSADGGRSWLPRLTAEAPEAPPYDSPPYVDSYISGLDLLVSPAAGGTVYLAGSEGVWKTTNDGNTWEAASKGIPAQPVYSLAVATDAESTVYAALESGLFRSRDGGRTWRRTHRRGALRPYSLLSVAPSDPQRLYGGGLRSDDGGMTWKEVFPSGYSGANPYATYVIQALVVDPKDENVLYLGGYYSTGYHAEDFCSFLVRTEDGGITWTDIGRSINFTSVALAIDPRRPRTLFALAQASVPADVGNGLFKSLDAGTTWEQVGSGLPLNWLDSATAFALAVDPDHPEVVYAGLPGQGIWMSSDGGGSFSAMSCGLPTGQVGSILVTPASDAPLYAGLPGLGVWAWNASPRCWTPLNSGLPAGDFTGAIVLGASGESTLHAGTGGNGLWRLDLP